MSRVGRLRGDRRVLAGERGDFAMFIAVIAAALLVFGSIAYDAPRLISARQHAVTTANEAAKVAAATVAAGGTLDQAEEAAEQFVRQRGPRYRYPGAQISAVISGCAGSRVEVTVQTSYRNRSALAVFRQEMLILETGGAEAVLVGPSGQPEPLAHLPECPLTRPIRSS